MIYILIALIAIASFSVGVMVAVKLLKKEYTGELVSGEKKVEHSEDLDLHEEETRKVELVDFEDLLDVDGDVIEAEPAPLVPEEHLYRAKSEIHILQSKVRDLELREQSQQFVIEKLKKRADGNMVDETPESLPEESQ
ncbi:hypothetical protein KKF84_01585 [Myxococcota bacterium]|nr:hypothetical protein [Myxococcota bacterium]MBU1533977.1 hypothetical protein [Myxococcota bacterium]